MRSCINRIVTDLRHARIMSIIKNRTYRFRIYSDDDIYKSDDDNDVDYIIYFTNDQGDIVITRKGEYSGDYTLYKNLSETEVTDPYYDRIRFKPHGTALSGTIGLKNKEEKIIKIVVSQLGRVRVDE